MADTPYPIPREARESSILVGDGTAGPYGPSAYKVFDTADVAVFAKASGETAFSDVTDAVTVTKTAAAEQDTFSLTFDTALPATTQWYHQARRVAERSVAVTRAGTIAADQLEKELSKQASAQSEMRRDIDRSLKLDFGLAAPKPFPPPQAGRVVAGNEAEDGWVNKTAAELGGPVLVGDAGLALVGKDTVAEVQAYAGVPYLNVRANHAIVADGRSVEGTTISMGAGSKELTATGGPFSPSDVGRSICVPGAGAGGGILFARVAAYFGSNQVTLSVAAGAAVSSVTTTLRLWTDQSAPMAAAAAEAALTGRTLFLPAQGYEYGFDGAGVPLGAGGIHLLAEPGALLRYYEGQPGSLRYLFKDIADTAKGDLTFENLTVKGTLDLQGRRAGNPFWLDHYRDVRLLNHAADQIAGEAMDFHFLRSFEASGGRYTNLAADAIRARDTPNCIVVDNTLTRIGDDAVAIHIADTSIAAWPTREGITVRGNHLTMAGAVSIEGARKASVADNHWKFATQGSCIKCAVLPSFLEGDVPLRDVDISGNSCENLLQVTSGTPGALGQFILVQGTAARGAASTNNTIPGDYDATAGAFVYPWDCDDVLTTDTDNPVPRMAGVRIHGNRCRRTAPNVAAISDYGFGSAIFQGVSYDPAINDAAFRQAVGVLIGTGGLHNAIISGNQMEHFQKGYTFAAPQNDRSYRSVLVAGNTARDFTVNGMLVNDAACSADILFDGNVLDGDIYRAAGNSNIDGTYDADGNPVGYELNGVQGIRVRGGSIANVCQPVHSTGGAVAEGVTLISALPAAIGFSGSNKGIGNAPRAGDGYRYWIVDADPTSATYRDHVTLQALEASVMPSTGSYVAGAFVKNSQPGLSGMVLGWLRITTGTDHVEGTDWLTVCASYSSTYTPTMAGVTNVDSITPGAVHYTRHGKRVRGWGIFTVDPITGANTASEAYFTLPVASNIALATDLIGGGSSDAVNNPLSIQADAGNDRAKINWLSGSGASHTYRFWFDYEVI